MRFSFAAAAAALAALPTMVSADWNLSKKDNIVLYWGQNAHGGYINDTSSPFQQKRLVEYCKDPAVDAISVAFVDWWSEDGTQLTINLSNSCDGWNYFPGGLGREGPSLLYCPTVSEDIIACQKTYGKKILMSIGGGHGGYNGFLSNQRAIDFAYTLWKTFGKGWYYYRPFGDAVVDGFDFNIESGTNYRYSEVARVLRKLMDEDKSKQWYLTGAPQCAQPDHWITDAVQKVKFDALFVQFYNNPKCETTSWKSGKSQLTDESFNYQKWHNWATTKSANKNIKLFLGAVLSGGVTHTGYVSRTVVTNVVKDIKKYSSFAGVMFWDASESSANIGFVAEIRKQLNNIQAALRKRDVVAEGIEAFKRRRHLHHHNKI